MVPSDLGDFSLSISREYFCSGVCSTPSMQNWPIALSRFFKTNLTGQTQISFSMKYMYDTKTVNYVIFSLETLQ